MGLIDSILEQQGGSILTQLAGQFGLDQATAENAVRSLVPALSAGLSKNISSPDGLQSLVSALQNGNHSTRIDNPAELSSPATTAEGNGILSHLLGSKEVSRQVAGNAAERTGISSSTLKQILPVVATLAMGVLSKRDTSPGGGGASSLIAGALGSFLKSDQNDGSGVEGLLGLAKQLF